MMIETKFDPEYCEEGEIAIYSSGAFEVGDREVLCIVKNSPLEFAYALKKISDAILRIADPDELNRFVEENRLK